MSEELNDQLESTNQPAEEAVNTEVVEEDSAKEDTEDKGNLEELNKKLYERAKKAEAEAKELKAKLQTEKKPEPTPQDSGMPITDIVALSKIHEDDIEEVVNYAKFKKLPVKEVLKTGIIKTLLSERAEERKTAAATSTGAQKRGSVKATDDNLLDKALSSGELPDSQDDLVRLATARINSKKQK